MNLEILSSDLLNVAMLAFMGVTGVAIARIRNLFAVVMLSGIYSLLGATLYVTLTRSMWHLPRPRSVPVRQRY